MLKVLISIVCSLFVFTIHSQDQAKYALVKYDFVFDSGIVSTLDETKLIKSAMKEKHSNLLSEIREKCDIKTFAIFWKAISDKENLDIAPPDALEDQVKYRYNFPSPYFAKKTVKKKGDDLGFENYIVCRVSLSMPTIANGVLGFKVATNVELEILNNLGKVIRSEKVKLKTPKPINALKFNGPFDKTDSEHYVLLYEKMIPTIESAIQEAIENIELMD